MRKKLVLLFVSAIMFVSAVDVVYCATREEIPLPAPPRFAGGN